MLVERWLRVRAAREHWRKTGKGAAPTCRHAGVPYAGYLRCNASKCHWRCVTVLSFDWKVAPRTAHGATLLGSAAAASAVGPAGPAGLSAQRSMVLVRPAPTAPTPASVGFGTFHTLDAPPDRGQHVWAPKALAADKAARKKRKVPLTTCVCTSHWITLSEHHTGLPCSALPQFNAVCLWGQQLQREVCTPDVKWSRSSGGRYSSNAVTPASPHHAPACPVPCCTKHREHAALGAAPASVATTRRVHGRAPPFRHAPDAPLPPRSVACCAVPHCTHRQRGSSTVPPTGRPQLGPPITAGRALMALPMLCHAAPSPCCAVPRPQSAHSYAAVLNALMGGH